MLNKGQLNDAREIAIDRLGIESRILNRETRVALRPSSAFFPRLYLRILGIWTRDSFAEDASERPKRNRSQFSAI